jgi:hypothetical protein
MEKKAKASSIVLEYASLANEPRQARQQRAASEWSIRVMGKSSTLI